MKKILFIIIAITSIMIGCNKTKQTMNKIYGDYTIIHYTVNGQDSLSQYRDSLGSNFSFNHDEYNDLLYLRISGSRNDGTQTSFDCAWGLKSDNKTLQIKKLICCMKCMGPFGNDNDTDWEIIILKNHEIKLRTIYSSKEYIIELN